MKMGLVTHSDPTFMFFPYVADYAENMKVTPKSVTAVTDWAHAINIRGGGYRGVCAGPPGNRSGRRLLRCHVLRTVKRKGYGETRPEGVTGG
jgi:hypothetical protein